MDRSGLSAYQMHANMVSSCLSAGQALCGGAPTSFRFSGYPSSQSTERARWTLVAKPGAWTSATYRPGDLPVVWGTYHFIDWIIYILISFSILSEVKTLYKFNLGVLNKFCGSVLVYGHAIKAIIHEKVSTPTPWNGMYRTDLSSSETASCPW